VRPLLRPLAAFSERGEDQWRLGLGWMMVVLAIAAWFTDTIGLYSVFGAFFLGMAVPRGRFARELGAKIEPLTSALLVPMFFVYSGLNTRLDLVSSPSLWLATAAVLAAAVIGKSLACYLAARACGETRRDAAGVGMLMNARGLMELIIINIGLERGIIGSTLFSILVCMAMATTLMSTPLFRLTYGRSPATPATTDAPPTPRSSSASRP
jgi:Kef-type K+ transport system membrane component KefB